ncbi:tetratricopeptide repeat protein, partial [Umezakia ovalisporum]|uniref:tetratricopeptide repeat protein n=1 Tax=Umezakia ovalisporum TaxID=75695 RepID=UPI0039C62881
MSVALANMSLVYLDMKDYRKALEYNKKSLSIAEEINSPANICNTYQQMGLIYVASLDSSDESKNPYRMEVLNT